MKRTPVFFIFVLVLHFSLPINCLSASAPDLNYNEFSALPPVNSAVVIRQQKIQIDSAQLSDKTNQSIHLILFDNVAIDAILKKHHRTPDGAFIWEGIVNDQQGSSVLFVIQEGRVSGEISYAGSLFHVRTLDDGSYIAQEIKQSFAVKRERRAFVNGVTDDVITLTNEERAKYGLQPLAYNTLLHNSAQGHATDMAQNDYYSHTSLDGRSPSDRITDAGYIWNYAAENIAAGYTSAVAVVNGWINSPGHHANMISSTACDIGVGYDYNAAAYYRHYWVQNFGREMGVSSCPSIVVGKAPDVVTGAATEIGPTSVQLNGTVNPNGLATTYYFEVGYTTAYGSASPQLDAGSGSSPLTVQYIPTGFLPLTTYHYRLVAFNSRGITYGKDVAFMTTDRRLPIGPLFLLLNQGAN